MAIFKRVASADILRRSSQTLSVVGSSAYIFGGELEPRKPRDNDVHVVDLETGTSPWSKTHSHEDILRLTLCRSEASVNRMVTMIPAKSSFPSPRVGSAATTLAGKVYIYSGRGGISMAPVEEHGSLLVFDPVTLDWSVLSPVDAEAPYPEARSYHCLASDGSDTIYVHAGCPEKGRLSDLWSFRVSKRLWTKLTSAPDPPRGGTSIAFTQGLLFRMHGFDGKTEQGGSLDFYDPDTDSWSTIQYNPDGKSGPIPSSVSSLLPVTLNGRASLVTLFGELDPSALGHEGAGKMSDYIWKYDIKDKKWSQIREGAGDKPAPRGWFAADALGEGKIVVHGGLDEENTRLGDIWIIDFSS